MNSHIALLKYNNYFNRIVKHESYYEAYQDYIIGDVLNNINFNPNDGVDTELVINWNSETPDYLLELQYPHLGATSYEVVSRWFVMECKRLRNGQYHLTLKRDIMADYYDEALSSPCFIQKGYVNVSNPLIFNRENVSVNQIKQSETLLKDKSKCGWIVGYIDPTYPTENLVIDGISSQAYIPSIDEFAYSDLVGKTVNGDIIKDKTGYAMFITSTYPKNDLSQGHPFCNLVSILQNGTKETSPAPRGEFNLDDGTTGWLGEVYTNNGSRAQASDAIKLMDSRIKTFNMVVDDQAFYKLYTNTPNRDIHDIMRTQGNVYRNKEGKFVKVVISNLSTEKADFAIKRTNYAASFNYFHDALKRFSTQYGYQLPYDPNTFYNVHVEYQTVSIGLVEVQNPNATIKINFSANANILKDAPYKMFCIPYDGEIATSASSDTVLNMNKEYSLNIATAIANKLQPASGTAGGHLYDIQLLPYCPIIDWFETLPDSKVITLKSNYKDKIDYDYVTDASGKNSGIIFYPLLSSFTTNIPVSIKVPANPIDFKVARETNLFRLVSPNYANFEDFDPYLNNGVDYINVDCTYKPFTPYVKLNINFKNLYGDDFNDARGLILGGDFSLPLMSDAWITYQIQNKNYNDIFSREMDNLDVTHKWQKLQDIVGAAGGTVQGGVYGGVAGYTLGGPLGMTIGAGIGAATSAAAGIADVYANEMLYRENKDLRQDLFSMQLDNIQAKPKGLVKTSAFNYNSRIWPFIEVYSSTEIEKTALKNKLKYNGMTVNVVGSISDYNNYGEQTYVQGDLIRFNSDKAEDAHLVAVLADEIKKGVYI